ncbi:MAG TPA: tRNA (N(6)-L-threonylcarbamoyladenosine(37)-C(2))-methylthiotransferase MtaB [bacterium]|nr:tRNA (N(6)-L-threonylcarbamoyladenosine(37)-C(2))-methylthiotransferase MtaB [bacterium]
MRIFIKFFGCKINQYESESLRETLAANGNEIICGVEEADVLIVVSCAVTDTAVQKLRKYVASAKSKKNNIKIIISGCAVDYLQKTGEYIFDAYCFKNEDKFKIPEFIARMDNNPVDNNILKSNSVSGFDSHSRGLIKIQDGCDNFCSYCVIPYLRNRLVSRPDFEIINEFEMLLNNGYTEIILTGINISKYDYNGISLEGLLKKIIVIKKDFRIRISSINLRGISDRLMNLMKNSSKICPHLHISLQSGSDKILKLMNRKYSASEYLDAIFKLKENIPDIGLTTDLIIGFPGESDKDFFETCEFVKKIGFGRIHIFPYSDRIITASYKMSDKISNQTKKMRCSEIKKIALFLQEKFIADRIGKTYSVVPESAYDGSNQETLKCKKIKPVFGYTENYIRGVVKNYASNNDKNFFQAKISGLDRENNCAAFDI